MVSVALYRIPTHRVLPLLFLHEYLSVRDQMLSLLVLGAALGDAGAVGDVVAKKFPEN